MGVWPWRPIPDRDPPVPRPADSTWRSLWTPGPKIAREMPCGGRWLDAPQWVRLGACSTTTCSSASSAPAGTSPTRSISRRSIEELRAFDVESQTSVAKLSEVSLWPARELDLRAPVVERALREVDALDVSLCLPEVREAWERDREQLREGVYDEGVDLFHPYLAGNPPATLFDHAGRDAVVMLAGGREAVLRSAQRHAEEIENLRAQEEERGELPAGARTGLLTPAALLQLLETHRCIELVRESDGDIVLDWRGVDSYVGRINAFSAAGRVRTAAGGTVLAVSRQQHRVEELVRDDGLDPLDVDDFDPLASVFPPGALLVTGGDLSQGFSTGEAQLDVFTDHELFC